MRECCVTWTESNQRNCQIQFFFAWGKTDDKILIFHQLVENHINLRLYKLYFDRIMHTQCYWQGLVECLFFFFHRLRLFPRPNCEKVQLTQNLKPYSLLYHVAERTVTVYKLASVSRWSCASCLVSTSAQCSSRAVGLYQLNSLMHKVDIKGYDQSAGIDGII